MAWVGIFKNTFNQNSLFSDRDYILIIWFAIITGWRILRERSFKRSVKGTFHSESKSYTYNQKQVYESKKPDYRMSNSWTNNKVACLKEKAGLVNDINRKLATLSLPITPLVFSVHCFDKCSDHKGS